MSLASRILAEAHKIEIETGRRPNRAFLNPHDMLRLVDEAQRAALTKVEPEQLVANIVNTHITLMDIDVESHVMVQAETVWFGYTMPLAPV